MSTSASATKPPPPTAVELTPRLALVPGEPAGIGPELCVRLAQEPRNDCRLLASAPKPCMPHRRLFLPLRLLADTKTPARPANCACTIPNASAAIGRTDPLKAAGVIAAMNDARRCLPANSTYGTGTGTRPRSIGGIRLPREQPNGWRTRHAVVMMCHDIVRVAGTTPCRWCVGR